MHTKKKYFACAALAGLLLNPQATIAAPGAKTVHSQKARVDLISDITQSWQDRILSEGLAVDNPKSWARRMQPKLARLSDEQLRMAERAQSLEELELLFMESPIAHGAKWADVFANPPGNLTLMTSGVTAKADTGVSSDPVANPDLYRDLVFTAVQPCRIADSRFSTSPAAGLMPANSTRTVRVGPYATYATYGGQATPCLGAVGTGNMPAAILAAVSTVNQTGAGYLVFYSSGGTNPNPYGVAQWFQPGYVQTSFVMIPTDLIDPTWA